MKICTYCDKEKPSSDGQEYPFQFNEQEKTFFLCYKCFSSLIINQLLKQFPPKNYY